MGKRSPPFFVYKKTKIPGQLMFILREAASGFCLYMGNGKMKELEFRLSVTKVNKSFGLQNH